MSVGDQVSPETRRSFVSKATASSAAAAALFGGFGMDPLVSAAMAQEMGRSEKPLKAAFSNAGLQATWCAQGKQAAEFWGKLFNVEVTWFDGELSATKQRAAIDNMASQTWDFVAIQAFGIGTLTDPVKKMIDAGIPVHRHGHADRTLGPDQRPQLPGTGQRVHGRGGDPGAGRRDRRQGHDHHDPGCLGPHRRAGPRQGLHSVVDKYPDIKVLDKQPADWDVTKATRIWDSLLTKYPDISAAFFHNDDMALAAQNVMKARGRDKILIGGVDAMPPAIEAVIDGRMLATVRNPSCRIHGGSMVAGVAAVLTGEKTGRAASPSMSSPTGRWSPSPTRKACCGCRSTS